MERLRLTKAELVNGFLVCYPQNNTGLPEYVMKRNPYRKIVEKLKEYEDLEEQGKLLKLPCALGSTVYRIRKCEAPSCERCRGYTWVGNCYTDYKGRIFVERFVYRHIDSYGKTVFLTRKEAEEALKRMKDGNETD